MTQEEKQLLLIDLCARLPYGVICKTTSVYYDNDDNELGQVQGTLVSIDKCSASFVDYRDNTVFGAYFEHNGQIGFKPYLRPISSMTESEIDKLFDILHIDKDGNDDDWIKINDVVGIKFFFPTGKWIENVAEAYDYLNSIHIDYRGLIEKGLALEASEDMY